MRLALLLTTCMLSTGWSLTQGQLLSDRVLSEALLQEVDSLVNDHILSLNQTPECDQDISKLVVSEELIKQRLTQIPTTIELSYNESVAKYLDNYLKHKGRSISFFLGLSQYYFPIFESILSKHNLPLELKYLAVIESALQPGVRSASGAVGIWQMMLPTAKSLGLKINTLVDERRDPYLATEAACLYLQELYRIYQDWLLAIAAYNCGPGTLNRAIKRAGGCSDFWRIYPYLPTSTRHYIPAMTAVTYAMHYADDHGICPSECPIALNSDTLQVNKEISFTQIAEITGLEIEQIELLNPQYTKSTIPGHIERSTLRLPIGYTYDIVAYLDSITQDSHQSESIVMSSSNNIPIPKASEIANSYIVKHGDSLYAISRRYATTVEAIKKSNKLTSDRLKIGQKLNLPQ